ncbi:MAG: chorismate mutase [Lachnospiraceae bacterium]
MSLENIRIEIDKIDEEIAALFLQRMKLSKQVAEEKKASKTIVLNAQREEEILQKLSEQVGPLMEPYIRTLYGTMFQVSRAYQRELIEGEESCNMD